jgi:hypothetical protein
MRSKSHAKLSEKRALHLLLGCLDCVCRRWNGSRSQTPNANKKKLLTVGRRCLDCQTSTATEPATYNKGDRKMSKQQQRQNVFFQIVVDHLFGFLHNSDKKKVEDLFYLDKKGKKIISAELNLENLFKIFLDSDGELLEEFIIGDDELDEDLLEFMMDDVLDAVRDEIPDAIWDALES